MKALINFNDQQLYVRTTSKMCHSITLTESTGKLWSVDVGDEATTRAIVMDFLDDGRNGIFFEYFPQVLESIKNSFIEEIKR